MTRPPNILFLMSDEHRPDVVGYEGHPRGSIARTPTLDWLAGSGVVFRNAYTPSPICVPARQCVAAGQLPRTCGVERYGQDLPPNSMTFARRFAEHGYDTVACGKLHHMGPDQMQGWLRRVGMDHMIGARPRGVPFPGAPGHLPKSQKWDDAKEIRRAGVGYGPHTAARDDYALEGLKLYIDEMLVDAHYDKGDPDRPMLLYLGLSNPHYPYFADEDLFRYYLNRVEPYVDEPAFDHPWLGKAPFMPGPVRVGPEGDVSEREVRRATAAYYANVERIDRQFGEAIDAIREAGQDPDDWIILYTSDHGEMLGEHSIWEKQKFFEASARVPLIIRWPKRFKRRVVEENVNLCDLFATLCELAEVPLPTVEETVHGRGLDSRSVVPLMRGETAEWATRHNDETVSQFAGTNLMIKRASLKYQWYDREECRAHPEVLFDLAAEPDERRNLIAEPRYAEAVGAFRRRRDQLGFDPSGGADYRNAGYAAR